VSKVVPTKGAVTDPFSIISK